MARNKAQVDEPAWGPSMTIVHDEIDRRRASYEQRSAAIDSKAALLITGSGILAIASGDASSGWTKAAIAANVLSALLGVICSWPRRGKDVGVAKIRDELVGLSAERTEAELADIKIEAYESDSDRLNRRAYQLSAGFAIFTISIVFVLISAFT